MFVDDHLIAKLEGASLKLHKPEAKDVAIVCNDCGPTRIGYRFEGTDKIRVCRKCGKDL